MRLLLFEGPGAGQGTRLGVLRDDGVHDVSRATAGLAGVTPQLLMQEVIDEYEDLAPLLEEVADSVLALPLDVVRIRPPLPRPGKILCCIGNYWEHAQREPRALNMFLKNPDAVIGDGDTIALPEFTDAPIADGPGPYVFQHEAELGLVIKGPARKVSQADWRRAVFGVTGMIDVSARADGRSSWRQGSWMGKSFDTFAPIGPCITTLDEVEDPNALHVQFWNDGDLRHDYTTDDMEHRVPQLIEFATGIMTLHSGDLIACGTNHEGLGPLQDGETCVLEVEKVGRMTVHVKDPLKRTWERGVYMGPNSTNPEAVRRAREAAGQA
jgi:2-keto-4-pentenoate hydratase/2-oxohepta-3-ene-1,7-dioic acid hydratase in catechol pathway